MHDLHAIFAMTAVGDARLELRTLGHLVHRGVLVARDPLTADAEPFAARFPPGRHRVEALVMTARGDERIALARIVFGAGEPATFELATRGSEDLRMLAPGQRFGYGVDAGTGCFATPEALAALDSDVLLAELEAHARLTWCWAALAPKDGGHELIAFSSGYGDGVYSNYIGRSSDGAPLCLVTDFKCLELELPELPDDPAFRRAHATAAYERMKAAVPRLGTNRHGDAYVAAADFVASPDDTEHLADAVLADLRGARGELERDLFRWTVAQLSGTPAVQRAFAAQLGVLDRADLDRLRVTPEHVEPALFAAAAALTERGDVASRVWFLKLGDRATNLAASDRELLVARAIGEIAAGDTELVTAGLSVLRRAAFHKQLSTDAVPHVREAARRTTDLQAKRSAFTLLRDLGEDLTSELAAPDPETRLAAVRVLDRSRDDVAAVCLEIARDTTLSLALRREAMHELRDQATKVALCVELALAGDDNAAGALRWIDSPAARTAAEQLAREATNAEVRAIAAHVAKSLRDIAEMKQRQG